MILPLIWDTRPWSMAVYPRHPIHMLKLPTKPYLHLMPGGQSLITTHSSRTRTTQRPGRPADKWHRRPETQSTIPLSRMVFNRRLYSELWLQGYLSLRIRQPRESSLIMIDVLTSELFKYKKLKITLSTLGISHKGKPRLEGMQRK